jgi:membrane protease YdiL (CAAX protease family)
VDGEERDYRSKVDWWLYGVFALALVVLWGSAVSLLFAKGSVAGRLAVAGVLALSGGLVAWIALGTRYRITSVAIRIRSGPLRWSVPLASITSVTPTHNPLSSPALSLDRLKVVYGGRFRWVMISPEPRDAFLDDLAARAPHLHREGNRLVSG